MAQAIVPTLAGSAGEILAHLEEVLASPPFRSSQRSCQFLQHIVATTLEGRGELLKERLIGERIFGRPPDYDTGQDSIVRVKANEVRRRLAQYYDLHPGAPLRIELSAGSYVAQFHSAHAPVEGSGAPAPRPARSRMWIGAAVAGLVSIAALGMALPRPSPFDRFWKPFLRGSGDLLICIPAPETYRIYGADKPALLSALAPRPPAAPPRDAPPKLADVEIVPEPGMFVGLGDARAMTLLYSFATGRGRPPKILISTTTTFTELRGGPGVLIGGFTNNWTMGLNKDHRFQFYFEDGQYGIRDTQTGQALCVKQRNWEAGQSEDCALITRLVKAKTGQPLLVAAGLNHFGTFAVGEFLTRPEQLEAALGTAPDWSLKNLQIVFRVEIVQDNVGPPKVLAVHTW